MKIGECVLNCYECRKTLDYEEVEIIERYGKRFWVCPKCEFETPIVEFVYTIKKKEMKRCQVSPSIEERHYP